MGYEHKLYVVKKGNFTEENGKRWASVVAVVDISKCYPLNWMIKDKPETDCFFYADDGNTRIDVDMYGDPLTELTPSEAVEVLEAIVNGGIQYDRLNIALAMLRAAKDEEDLAVLHYGY